MYLSVITYLMIRTPTMIDSNKGRNNVSKNRVITTDKLYDLIRGCLLRWYLLLVAKMILFIALLLIIYRMFLYISISFMSPKLLGLGNLSGLGYWFLMVIVLNALSAIHELQSEPEHIIDSYYFEYFPVHWLQLFPGKGMRLAHREVRRYRRQKKLRKKEHKEKQ